MSMVIFVFGIPLMKNIFSRMKSVPSLERLAILLGIVKVNDLSVLVKVKKVSVTRFPLTLYLLLEKLRVILK